ncbi:MAG: hypothetical protein DMG08_29175 [Acidobacteria bacterium]|nr:MAG: hypothetical protein DMG08_29175 [Acidobacteriota bacterium]
MMKAIRFLLRWFLARPGAVFLTGFGLAVAAAVLESAPGMLIATFVAFAGLVQGLRNIWHRSRVQAALLGVRRKSPCCSRPPRGRWSWSWWPAVSDGRSRRSPQPLPRRT